MKYLLTEDETRTIRSMNLYWEEVMERDDTSPLSHEVQQVFSMLGPIRFLRIVAQYATEKIAAETENAK